MTNQADEILKRSDDLFRHIRKAGTSDSVALAYVHAEATKLTERFSDIKWAALPPSTLDQLERIALSWQCFAYRYGLAPIDFTFPDFPVQDLPEQPTRTRLIKGRVVKKSSDKTVSVEVDRTKVHSLYGKVMRRTKKFLVHDEFNQASVGDEVLFEQTRPFSKRKTHALVAFNSRNPS